MSEQKYFSIEATAKFFCVSEPTIHEWLRRQELIAKLRGNRLTIGADAIAALIERMPERAPAGAALGVQRQKLKRIITSENRGQLPAKIN